MYNILSIGRASVFVMPLFFLDFLSFFGPQKKKNNATSTNFSTWEHVGTQK
jgi:hypothetical protein